MAKQLKKLMHHNYDVKFDTAGNMYVAEWGNNRVQVFNTSDRFIQAFGEKGKGKLSHPSGLFISDKYVYVSNYDGNRIVVFHTSGQFVTSFGKSTVNGPRSIASSSDGFIHVCDTQDNEVLVF